MTIFGIDYAWDKPSISGMVDAGVKFICRYLSHDPTKDLTFSEAMAAGSSGIWCVVVWETTANRALSGNEGGKADATVALRQANALGMPSDRPIYFAVDWDVQPGQQSAIHSYLDGAASVLGRDRVGMYSGYGPMVRAFDAGKITWGWQTYAWSGGKWDSRAHIQQYKNGVKLAGGTVDYDRAMFDDYGQWKVDESPMALSDADKKWILSNVPPAVWKVDNVVKASDDGTENPYWGPNYHMYEQGKRLRQIAAAMTTLQSPDVDESAIIAGVLAGIDPDTLADVIATRLGPEVAGNVLDALKSRLES